MRQAIEQVSSAIKQNLLGNLRPFSLFSLIVFGFLCSGHASAEVYKWVDAQGNTHFGDRPPSSATSEDISQSLETMNISTDLSSPEMIRSAEQARHNEKVQSAKQRAQDLKDEREHQEAHKKYCREATKRLMNISGPVVFYDEYGEEVKTSEQERKKMEKELRAEIARNCK